MTRLLCLGTLLVVACSQTSGDFTDAQIGSDTVIVDYGNEVEGSCTVSSVQRPDFVRTLKCVSDFDALSSRPLTPIIPGAWTVKTLVDLQNGDVIHFVDTKKYETHYEFVSSVLKWGAGEASFDKEYYSETRRFLLGAVTRYESPPVWTYEIEPWDTASASMVTMAFELIATSAFFGSELYFHPISDHALSLVLELPQHIKVITTEEILEAVDYQPLSLGTTIGKLRFAKASEIEQGSVFVSPLDIVVLDNIPHSLPPCAGVISSEFETPLSYTNIRAIDRQTPNMALRRAEHDSRLRALEGKWVRLTVGPFNWSILEVTQEEAESFGTHHSVKVIELDAETKDLREVSSIVFPGDLPAFGGKAAHYGELARIGQDDVPLPKAFAIPIYYYKQFEQQHGFDKEIQALLADPMFMNDPQIRDAKLGDLRSRMQKAAVDKEFISSLKSKIATMFPGQAVVIESSSNAEDIAGLSVAGLYDSCEYGPDDSIDDLATAVKRVWASLYNFSAFEERSSQGVDHLMVGMGLLCRRSFSSIDAGGAALTANIFNAKETAFYINAQKGATSVTKPPKGVIADQFLYYFGREGHPMISLAHSSLVETVLSGAQTFVLARALNAIHNDTWFMKMYGKGQSYGMYVEFLFNTEPGEVASRLWITGARPSRGW